MRSIELLMEEHRVIERALDLLEEAALKIDRGEFVDERAFTLLLKFFKEFADKCHHEKEEKALFPLLQSKGILAPVGVMLSEHDIGRRFIKALEEDLKRINVDPEVRRSIVDNALSYVGLLREHKLKEDSVLFRIASEVMSLDEDERLVEDFKNIEVNAIGPGVHEQLIKLLDDVEKALGG